MIAASLSTPAAAQWFNYPTPGVPRTADGQPDLKAPTPKTPEGKPDLSGLWNPQGTVTTRDGGFTFEGISNDIGTGLKDGAPYQPWAAELVRQRKANFSKDHPNVKCLPLSPVHLQASPGLRRVVQTPGMLFILYEHLMNFRTIYTDGRPLPVDPQPAWHGYSTGKWEGDTLVVQTIGLRDDTWLDYVGSTMTSSGKIIERFRRPNYGNLEIEVTIDDPKAYTRPFTVMIHQAIRLNADLLEDFCENERDQAHMVGK
jgi:hypothetical protein